MMHQHPWLVLRAFLCDKPWAEINILSKAVVLYRPVIFLFSVLLSAALGTIIWTLNELDVVREHAVAAAWAALLTGFFCLSTTFIYPTADIPDTILFIVLLLLIIPACAPLYIKAKLWLSPPLNLWILKSEV